MYEESDELKGEKEGKTFSLKTSALIITGVLFFIVILLLSLRGCTISKEIQPEEVSKKQDEVVLVQEDQTTEKDVKKDEIIENSSEGKENSSSTVEKDSGNVGEFKEKKDDEITADKGENGTVLENGNSNQESKVPSKDEGTSDNLFKVDEPVLGESYTVPSLISGKNCYLVDESYYTYSLSLVIANDGGYDIVKYFCSKRIFDTVKSGETVNVSYQYDNKGRISVTSISK